MTAALLLAGLLLPGAAHARDGVAGRKSGLRLKLTQAIYTNTTTWTDVDGDAGDPTRASTLSLLTGAPRAELTWRFQEPRGLEVGLIGGYERHRSTFDGDDLTSGAAYTAMATAAWNFDLGDSARAFIQPMGGLREVRVANDAAETDTISQGWVYGGDIGLRVKLFRRVTFDPALEYLKTQATVKIDGDQIDDRADHTRAWGLRWGLSVML